MNFRAVKKFIKLRRYTVIVFFILAVFLLSSVLTPQLLKYFNTNWKTIANSRNNYNYSLISQEFETREMRIINETNSLCEELLNKKSDLMRSPEQNNQTYFDIFNKYADRTGLQFQLIKNRSEVIAWTGRKQDIEIEVLKNLVNDLIFVSQKNFYDFLIFIKIIKSPSGQEYLLIASDLLNTDYYISNRYLQKSVFFTGYDGNENTVLFRFNNSSKAIDTTRYVAYELKHINKTKAGTVYFEKSSLQELLEEVKESVYKIQKILILLLILIFYIHLYRDFRRINSHIIKAIVFSFFLWMFRYLLIYLAIPGSLFDFDILNPVYFSSLLGNGLFKSPMELFITVVFSLINFSYIFVVTRRWYLAIDEGSNSIYKVLLCILAILVINVTIPLVLRGYTETFRSFIFDSSLKYFDTATILPGFTFVFMHINVFLAGLCFFLILIVILTINLKMLRIISPNMNYNYQIIVLLLSVVIFIVIFKGIFQIELISEVFIVLIILFLYLILNNYRLNNHVFNFNLLILILIFSSLISIFLLIEKHGYKEKELQRRMAFELAKPKDVLTGFILNETLINISANEEIGNDFEEAADRNSYDFLAYKFWIQSLLNTEGIKSSISALNTSGKLVGFFGFGLNEVTDVGGMINYDLFKEEILYFNHNNHPDLIFGAIKVVHSGKLLGYIVVTIQSNTKEGQEKTSTKIFANIQSERDPLSLLNDVVIYTFQNGEFSLKKGDNLPEFRQLPKSIADKSLDKINSEFWLEEKIEDKNYYSFYLMFQQNGVPRLLAVSLQEKPFLWYSFNFFRFAFIHFLISIFIISFIGLLLYLRGYKFTFHFKTKMFGGLVFITIIPLVFLAFYNRGNAIDRWNQTQRYELQKDLDYLEKRLLNGDLSENIKTGSTDIISSLNKPEEIEYDIFVEENMVYSTQEKFYSINFLNNNLPQKVFEELFLMNKSYSFVVERIGKYEYMTGFKKILKKYNASVIISIPTIYKKEKIDSEITQIDAFIFGAYSLTLILMFLLANFIFDKIAQPLKKLTEATQKIALGDLSVKLDSGDKTEVGDLVIAFNKMIDDLEESRKNLALAEREYAWKEMAKQVAHEIKNPLTPMKLSLQHLQLLFTLNRSEFIKAFSKISASLVDQVDTLSNIATEFSRFARMPERNIVKINLVSLVKDIEVIYSSNISVVSEFNEEISYNTDADYEELKRVLVNIVRNSIQAKATEVKIVLDKSDYIFIDIMDNGEGIPDEIMSKIFQPNFSTKTEGMGLGLSIIKKIIEELGGRIEIESKVGSGTKVRIQLQKNNEQ